MKLSFVASSAVSNVLVSKEVRVDLSGGRSDRRFTAIFRIDSRCPEEGFRVDRATICGWEAIDGGRSSAPRTLKEAKALAARFLAAMVAQGSQLPSGF